MAEEEKFAVDPIGMKGERREATSLAIWRVDAMVAGEERRGKSRGWGGGINWVDWGSGRRGRTEVRRRCRFGLRSFLSAGC